MVASCEGRPHGILAQDRAGVASGVFSLPIETFNDLVGGPTAG
jgi:hypothetical protein